MIIIRKIFISKYLSNLYNSSLNNKLKDEPVENGNFIYNFSDRIIFLIFILARKIIILCAFLFHISQLLLIFKKEENVNCKFPAISMIYSKFFRYPYAECKFYGCSSDGCLF